jgi:hypothetical protein
MNFTKLQKIAQTSIFAGSVCALLFSNFHHTFIGLFFGLFIGAYIGYREL